MAIAPGLASAGAKAVRFSFTVAAKPTPRMEAVRLASRPLERKSLIDSYTTRQIP